jgi:CRISPR-associated protein Csx14
MVERRLTLDPHNPGQFFACCGLFELAELAAPGGDAWFESGTSTFVLSTDATLMPPPQLGLESQANLEGKPYDATLEPLELLADGRAFELDWWLNETRTDKSPFKTHGGQQTPRRVLGELLGLLDYTVSLPDLMTFSVYTKSRLGLDARSAWEALDAGYSPNDIGQAAATFPWVEVLAAVGLQGFRPADDARFHFRYSAWLSPLSLVAARAAVAAPWAGLPSQSYRFQIAIRGQGYKTLQFAEGADHV